MPLRFSLTLDLHFKNGERRDNEDGAAVTVFLRASSKVLWTCSLSVASTTSAMLDMRRSGCGWVDRGFGRGGGCDLILVGFRQWCVVGRYELEKL
ncbi:hypothetical protein SO802_033614 [Lithocarpus litseifolius]|uniref:Uncharacterized protein n=1 Tax=Lithocarpus litseifolius TaxID=425828 RepID=A0AAW2BGF2_9ROSI